MPDLAPTIPTLAQLAGYGDSRVNPGDEVYVVDIDTDFIYRIQSPLPPIDGVSLIKATFLPGFWERRNDSTSAAMSQANWFIDSVNGSDANDGLAAGSALRTDAERQRRMGPNPLWSQAEYHLRYLNDLPTTDPVIIAGQLPNTATNIWLHGNQVNGLGKAVLATLAVDAITALNTGTNTPLRFTSNAIVTSWTADNILNQRCRMTSGAGLGGYVWPALDLGAKQAQMSETQTTAATAYSNPFTLPTSAFIPSLNDTFVVESLVTLGGLYINMTGGSSSTSTNTVILDSLAFSGYTAEGVVCVNMIGCAWMSTLGPTILAKTVQMTGSRIRAGSIVAGENMFLNSTYFDDSSSARCILRTGNALSTFARLMTVQRQGISIRALALSASPTSVGSANSSLNSIGIFNNSVNAGVGIIGTVGLSAAAIIWGVCGAGGPAFFLEAPGSRLVYGAAAPGAASYYGIDVTAAPSATWIGYRSAANVQTLSVVAWDPATSTYTAQRLLTKALLQATVATGFNGMFADPISQCSMTPG